MNELLIKYMKELLDAQPFTAPVRKAYGRAYKELKLYREQILNPEQSRRVPWIAEVISGELMAKWEKDGRPSLLDEDYSNEPKRRKKAVKEARRKAEKKADNSRDEPSALKRSRSSSAGVNTSNTTHSTSPITPTPAVGGGSPSSRPLQTRAVQPSKPKANKPLQPIEIIDLTGETSNDTEVSKGSNIANRAKDVKNVAPQHTSGISHYGTSALKRPTVTSPVTIGGRAGKRSWDDIGTKELGYPKKRRV